MDARVRKLAARQADLVAAWQLLGAGWTRHGLYHAVRQLGWRRVHAGVYALTAAHLTQHQKWMAATLTTPDSVLSHASAAACWGIREQRGSAVVITRPGNGGRRQYPGLLVLRSNTLEGDTTIHRGIRITTAARTLIDLAPHLNDKQLGRALREALRLKATSTRQLSQTLGRHRGGRGTKRLQDLSNRYSTLPYDRAKSDAESKALEVLDDAGVQLPQVNIHIAGEEADLVWPDQKLIIEIDGPQFHQFPAEDARKQRKWERAGYTVRRIGSQVVYDEPSRLVALVEAEISRVTWAQ